MKRPDWIQYLVVFLSLLLAVALFSGVYISNRISNASGADYLFESEEAAEAHVLLIYNEDHQNYDDAFMEGVAQVAATYRIAVEKKALSGNDYESQAIDVMKMAVYGGMDGIILHAIKSDAMNTAIMEAQKQGVPVFVMNEDLPESGRISYIGPSRYSIGQSAGKALAKAMGGQGRVAVIDQRDYSEVDDHTDDLMLLGLTEVLKSYEDLYVVLVKYTKQGVLSAESVTDNIMTNHPDVNGIFCTSWENAMGVAQVMIDNNSVHQYDLIGFGDEYEMLDYIARGTIVQATVVADTKAIGEEAMKAFAEYGREEFVSSYITTSLMTVDQDNIDAYMEALIDE